MRRFKKKCAQFISILKIIFSNLPPLFTSLPFRYFPTPPPAPRSFLMKMVSHLLLKMLLVMFFVRLLLLCVSECERMEGVAKKKNFFNEVDRARKRFCLFARSRATKEHKKKSNFRIWIFSYLPPITLAIVVNFGNCRVPSKGAEIINLISRESILFRKKKNKKKKANSRRRGEERPKRITISNEQGRNHV